MPNQNGESTRIGAQVVVSYTIVPAQGGWPGMNVAVVTQAFAGGFGRRYATETKREGLIAYVF